MVFYLGTSIGSGILKALDVLSQSGPKRLRGFGGNIIILTDGLEHNQPKINDTLSDVSEFSLNSARPCKNFNFHYVLVLFTILG